MFVRRPFVLGALFTDVRYWHSLIASRTSVSHISSERPTSITEWDSAAFRSGTGPASGNAGRARQCGCVTARAARPSSAQLPPPPSHAPPLSSRLTPVAPARSTSVAPHTCRQLSRKDREICLVLDADRPRGAKRQRGHSDSHDRLSASGAQEHFRCMPPRDDLVPLFVRRGHHGSGMEKRDNERRRPDGSTPRAADDRRLARRKHAQSQC